MGRFSYIDTDNQLASFCKQAASADTLAIDTEFMREKTYFPRLCLLQVATREQIACIDPLAISQLDPLWALFENPDCVKVLHAARQDIEVIFQASGAILAPVFDTQVAAALCGYGDQIGYANLVEEVLGIQLDKSMTRADWSRRPLSQDALEYAADDVRHLFQVYEHLFQRLDERGRLEWLEPEMRSLLDKEQYVPDPSQAWRRVKGMQRLKPRQVARLQALAAWREDEAIRADRPRQWILRDEALIFMSQRPPRTPEDIASVRGVDEKIARKFAEIILARLEAAESAEAPADIPGKKQRLDSGQEAQLDILMSALKKLAADAELAPASIASRKDLEKLVRGEKDSPVLKGWRKAAAGDRLLEVLEGKLALRSADKDVQFE